MPSTGCPDKYVLTNSVLEGFSEDGVYVLDMTDWQVVGKGGKARKDHILESDQAVNPSLQDRSDLATEYVEQAVAASRLQFQQRQKQEAAVAEEDHRIMEEIKQQSLKEAHDFFDREYAKKPLLSAVKNIISKGAEEDEQLQQAFDLSIALATPEEDQLQAVLHESIIQAEKDDRYRKLCNQQCRAELQQAQWEASQAEQIADGLPTALAEAEQNGKMPAEGQLPGRLTADQRTKSKAKQKIRREQQRQQQRESNGMNICDHAVPFRADLAVRSRSETRTRPNGDWPRQQLSNASEVSGEASANRGARVMVTRKNSSDDEQLMRVLEVSLAEHQQWQEEQKEKEKELQQKHKKSNGVAASDPLSPKEKGARVRVVDLRKLQKDRQKRLEAVSVLRGTCNQFLEHYRCLNQVRIEIDRDGSCARVKPIISRVGRLLTTFAGQGDDQEENIEIALHTIQQICSNPSGEQADRQGRRAHVLIDWSNVVIGAKSPLLNARKLSALLEKDEKTETRVVATSQHFAFLGGFEKLKAQGYLGYCEKGKGKEAFVDGTLKNVILTLAHRQYPDKAKHTMRVVTGDGNWGGVGGNDEDMISFPAAVEAALQNGWSVEIWAWRQSTHHYWRQMETYYRSHMKMQWLDDFREYLCEAITPR